MKISHLDICYHDQLIAAEWLKYDNCRPAISIYSNIADLLKWISFHLKKGKVGQREILKADTIAELHLSQTVINDPEWLEYFPNSSNITYGFGWVSHVYQGRVIIEHSGNIQGASSLVAFVPQENLGIVVLTNRDSLTLFPRAILYFLLDQYSSQSPVDWNQFYFEKLSLYTNKQLQEEENFILNRLSETVSSLSLDQYSGEYNNFLYGSIQVNCNDDHLHLHSRTFNGKLMHWHLNTFKLLPNQFPSAFQESFFITFKLNENEQVDSFTIASVPGQNKIEFKKINE